MFAAVPRLANGGDLINCRPEFSEALKERQRPKEHRERIDDANENVWVECKRPSEHTGRHRLDLKGDQENERADHQE